MTICLSQVIDPGVSYRVQQSEVKGFCFGKMNSRCLKLLLWMGDILYRLIGFYPEIGNCLCRF